MIYQGVPFRFPFLMVLSSDSKTGATGKTVTATVRKNGATAFTAVQGTIVEIGNGWYDLLGNSNDASALGPIAFHFAASACDDTDDTDTVIPATNNNPSGFGAVGNGLI